MATEFNFVAKLDKSQIMSGLSEIRSQVGMSLGSATGFSSPAMGISGGGADFSAGVSQSAQMMFAGLQQTPNMGGSGFGGTFTNPAMAYSPHYGAVQATTSLEQEWAVHRGGMAAAQMMKPPGVSAGAYGLGMEQAFISRQVEASDAAKMAGQQAMVSGAGGLLGGEAASMIATPLGAMAGGALASRFLGSGAAGAGAMIGGLAAGYMAWDKGSEFVSGKINQRYAEMEQIRGVTTELGEIAGAGRNLTRTQRYDLGVSARDAAKEIGMSTQEMGDVLALGRQAGMLPSSSEPGKAREQYRDFARAIEEGAQVLGSSLASATAVIKQASQQGMSAREGIVRAAGAGGAEQYLAQQSQPSWINNVYSAMAGGPLGTAQTMAAMGGKSMAGMGMMDLPGAAMAGLNAGGGDMLSNAASFMVHQDQYVKGMGAGGRATMARQQLSMGGEMIQSMMPDMSTSDAKAFFAMNTMGMSGADARRLAAGGGGGGGGGIDGMSYEARATAINALTAAEHVPGAPPPPAKRSFDFSLGAVAEGAMTGAMVAGPWGAAGGAVLGFAANNLGALKDNIGGLFSGVSDLWNLSGANAADAGAQRANAEYDSRAPAGPRVIDPGAYKRFLTRDVSSTRLDMDRGGSGGAYSAADFYAAGMTPVAAGAGTIKKDGEYWSAEDAQAVGRGSMWSKPLKEKERVEIEQSIKDDFYGNVDAVPLQAKIDNFMSNYDTVTKGASSIVGEGVEAKRVYMDKTGVIGSVQKGLQINAAKTMVEQGKELLGSISDPKKRADLVGRISKPGGPSDSHVVAALQTITGGKYDPEKIDSARKVGAMGAEAQLAAEGFSTDDRTKFLAEAQAGYLDDKGGYAGKAMPHTYWKLAQENRHWQAADKLWVEGKETEAKKEYQMAQTQAQVEVSVLNPHLRAVDVKAFDPSAKVINPDAARVANKIRTQHDAVPDALRAAARSAEDAGLSAVAKPLNEKANSIEADPAHKALKASAEVAAQAVMLDAKNVTTMGKELEKETKDLGPRHKRGGGGGGGVSRAIGFGEQEATMDRIQRALASTEKGLRSATAALATVEKKISGMGANPQASKDPPG